MFAEGASCLLEGQQQVGQTLAYPRGDKRAEWTLHLQTCFSGTASPLAGTPKCKSISLIRKAHQLGSYQQDH